MQGTVTVEADPDLTNIDRVARHYTKRPYRRRDQQRISAWLEIQTYHVWGFR
jgi:hypothetical protein